MHQLLLLLILTTQVFGDSIAPHDLVDEAQNLLDELREELVFEIQAAHLALDDLAYTTAVYGNGTFTHSSARLSSFAVSVSKRVALAKALVKNSPVDKTHCLEGEPEMATHLVLARNHLLECLLDINAAVSGQVDDAKYYIDVQYNKVTELQFQLSKCTSQDLICVSAVVTQIDESSVSLIQNVANEVEAVGKIVETLKLTYGSCEHAATEFYSVRAYEIIADMFACIEE